MEWKIDNGVPIYTQVISFIKQDIANGVYAAGSIIPPARELAIRSKINPNAVQRAIASLISERMLVVGADGAIRVNADSAHNEQIKQVLIDKRVRELVLGLGELGISDAAEIVSCVERYLKIGEQEAE